MVSVKVVLVTIETSLVIYAAIVTVCVPTAAALFVETETTPAMLMVISLEVSAATDPTGASPTDK